MAEFSEIIKLLAAQNAENQRQSEERMAALLAQLMNPVNLQPAASTTVYKDLSSRMNPFTFCPEENLTFDRWYARYQSIFVQDAATLTNAQKVSLLTEKLSDIDYQKFADGILPATKDDVAFNVAVAKLKLLFARTESVFVQRLKVFEVDRESGQTFKDFSSKVNMRCEKFSLATCDVADLKVLTFVKGLNDHHIQQRLKTKIEENEKVRAAAAVPENAIPKLTLDEVCEMAVALEKLKTDTTLTNQQCLKVEVDKHKDHILAVQQKSYKPKSGQNYGNKQTSAGHQSKQEPLAVPINNCHFCGELHWHRDCPFSEKQCPNCSKKGHKASHCESAAKYMAWEKARKERSSNRSNRNSWRRRSNAVHTSSISTRKFVEPAIDDKTIRLQLDSGSDWTIISEQNWRKLGSPTLVKCKEEAISASGDQVPMLGKFNARVKLHGREDVGPCYVAKSSLNVLGSDWLEALKLWNVPIASICNSIATATSQMECELRRSFPNLFSDSLGLCVKKASLSLVPDAKPIFRKSRPVPFAAAEKIEGELKRLQLLGVITPVRHAAYAAPIVAVKKKDGRVRVCADYSTGLNNSLQSENFPLPTPDEIFAQISPFQIFSKIDLSDAFLQIELDESSKDLMTINTHCGLFRVNRLQPGVKPAPGIFQKLVCEMMSGAIGVFPFIDDFIVGGTNESDHRKNLWEALTRIQDFGFHIKLEKCSFAQKQIEFLGHIINANGVKPSPEKLATLQAIPAPVDVPQLQAFLGAVTWYAKFIPNIKEFRGPLDELLCKSSEFVWVEKHQESFEKLKKILSSDLALAHYDPNKKLIVAADASSFGMGGVLLHEMNDGSKRPVMHAARAFSASEKNYPQIQREALALIFALKKFHRYVYGRHFELQTDHKPLLAIFGNKKGIPVHTASRLQRYALILLAYDFEICYINTESFAFADFISRLISTHEKPDEEVVIGNMGCFIGKVIAETPKACFALDTAKILPVTFEAIQEETNRNESLKQVAHYIENGWPEKEDRITEKEVAELFQRRASLIVINGCIFFGDRIIIPKRYQDEILKEMHKGHPGIERMKLLARQKVFWPAIDKDIEKTVRCCNACATNTFSPIKTTLHSWPIPTSPWSRLHIDFAGPVEGFWYFVIIDAFSKWPEVFKMTSTTTQQTIDRLNETFARHGLCDTIVSDNGPQFTSGPFEKFCTENGIMHLTSAPYHPQSNGQAERFVQTLKQGLKKLANEGNSNDILRKFLSSYRSTPSYNLGMKSPHELMSGRKMKTVLDLLKPQARVSEARNVNMERQFNTHHGARQRDFEIGDKVFVKVYSSNSKWKWVEGEVLQRTGNVNYVVMTSEREVHSHANQLKKRFTFLSESNPLLQAFELDLPHVQVEPEIVPEAEEDDEIFEDAIEEQHEVAEPVEQDVPVPVGPLRRSQRPNAGVPPRHLRDYVRTVETSGIIN